MSATLSRRSLTALGAATLLTGRMIHNAYQEPEVSRYRVPLAGLRRPLRLVQLSDLHTGPYVGEGTLETWIALANAQRPDLIAITGDFVDRFAFKPLQHLARTLPKLRAPLGVWGVWGNHDYKRFRELHPLARVLREAGVEMLLNRGVWLRDDLYLAGVDDVLEGVPDLRAALRGCPKGVASLLLSHNPDLLPGVPAWIGLTLCGHTHGGQIKLPAVGAVATSSRYGQRFAEGWVRAPAHAYISRGLGVTLAPMRLNCPPELAVFELEPR